MEIQRNGSDMSQKYWPVPLRALAARNLATVLADVNRPVLRDGINSPVLRDGINNRRDRPTGPAL
jgi:hypothetical protein